MWPTVPGERSFPSGIHESLLSVPASEVHYGMSYKSTETYKKKSTRQRQSQKPVEENVQDDGLQMINSLQV